MIPDYQSLMKPVLEIAKSGETSIRTAIDIISERFGLTEEEREELLPSGKQTVIANRVHWAKTYLKQAGLVKPTKRGFFEITDRGQTALADSNAKIGNTYLKQFQEFRDFQSRSTDQISQADEADVDKSGSVTPDEALRSAHKTINDSLADELLDRVRDSTPVFFENLIVFLMIAMGYGGSSEDAGRAIGRSGDDGVDSVIDQDPLGVDQIFIQAKRYAKSKSVGPAAVRDFFGALNLKRAHKGIFVTTSSFTGSAIETAKGLGMRIVLIDGLQLARLMIRYNIGCRDEDTLHLRKVDEDFFE